MRLIKINQIKGIFKWLGSGSGGIFGGVTGSKWAPLGLLYIKMNFK